MAKSLFFFTNSRLIVLCLKNALGHICLRRMKKNAGDLLRTSLTLPA